MFRVPNLMSDCYSGLFVQGPQIGHLEGLMLNAPDALQAYSIVPVE